MFEDISGHKKQLEFLENAIKRDRLAHAYTFAGPDSVGKRTVALRLAQELLQADGNNFHPDLLIIERPEDKKVIVIEQIRELVYKLSLLPYQAKYKVALIDNAEDLNEEAANALLKCLEEPKPSTIIILITGNSNRLPKTIISRTQKINFGLVAGPEFEKAGGKPGLARKMADDKEFLETYVTSENFYRTFIGSTLPEKLIAAYEIADMETPEIKNLLETWLVKLQAVLQTKAGKALADRISQVAQARRFLDQNANAKLLLTNLMLNT
ncbi:MAG: AAA family ATPase [Candidatus Doudnabacteria bacterium]